MDYVKVLHLITDLSANGAQMMLFKLLSRMKRQRFQNVVVILVGSDTMPEQLSSLGVPVYSLGLQRGRPMVHGLWALMRILAQERPTILQTWMYHADLLGLFAGRLARVRRIVWNIRGSTRDWGDYGRLTEMTVQLCARFSALPQAVVFNSQAGRKSHTALGYRPRRCFVIPNGFDVMHFRPDVTARASVLAELGIPTETILIGLIARYHLVKDHENFLRAAGILAKRYSNVRFLLVGRDVATSNSDLTHIVVANGLQTSVHLLGERADIPRIMAALDVLSVSSSSEGFPNVVGEAMSCGVPCIVTDVGDNAAIVGKTGRVVPPKNPQALADGWTELVDMGTVGRGCLGQRARQRVIECFTMEKVLVQYERLYESLATGALCVE